MPSLPLKDWTSPLFTALILFACVPGCAGVRCQNSMPATGVRAMRGGEKTGTPSRAAHPSACSQPSRKLLMLSQPSSPPFALVVQTWVGPALCAPPFLEALFCASSRAYGLGALLRDQSLGSGIPGPSRVLTRRFCFEPQVQLVSLPEFDCLLSLTGARAFSLAYELGSLLGDQSRGSGISGPAQGLARRSCFEPHSVLNLLHERKLAWGQLMRVQCGA